MQVRVYYEDTDAGGVVYHSNYLNFCERARSDVFFQKGLTPMLDDGHFVARRVIADYLLSSRLGDLLDIETDLTELKGASFILKQTIYNKERQKVFEMDITLVYISFEGKPQRINKELKHKIRLLFGISDKSR